MGHYISIIFGPAKFHVEKMCVWKNVIGAVPCMLNYNPYVVTTFRYRCSVGFGRRVLCSADESCVRPTSPLFGRRALCSADESCVCWVLVTVTIFNTYSFLYVSYQQLLFPVRLLSTDTLPCASPINITHPYISPINSYPLLHLLR